ncbi:HlyD family efflux transporter periplasmic adaptor subunit [Thalassomonas viridans]|uniref:HlyD family efflux transporter periplasmic adaptor subunit n=1 Tax=Thalassomonas viridans TaxID=137584 RepID=A0AAF0CBK7_9GAMM|nr:HlyD family efflux transporter periplasmic adaptor subunit [Thalassomonas viridans]WDE07858.1 HlyD family efflux transporter periplasmic adaptor subunit [Thalassomonas viridans]
MAAKKRQLFRKEVIEAMTARHGDVVLIRPVSFTIITGFILILITIALAFFSLGQYTHSLPVKGVLKSKGGDTKVMAYQPGVIEEIYIREGDKVAQGDPLYRVRTERDGQGGTVNEKLISSIRGSIKLTEEKIDYQTKLNALELEDLARSAKSYTSKAQQRADEIEIKNDYLTLLKSELSILAKLKKAQQATQLEYNAKYAQVLEARLAIKSLTRERLNLLEQADTAEKNIRNTKLQGQSMVVGYQQTLENLQRELAQKEADRFYMITAPKAGVVANIYYHQGNFVEVNKPLMMLLPQDKELVAEVYITAGAIGQIEEGQSINMRYHAFPYQKFGMFKGKIASISKTLIDPYQAKVESLVEGPSYRATVTLEQQHITLNEKSVALQTGMLLDADVIGDSRSILGWIFEPILSSIEHS